MRPAAAVIGNLARDVVDGGKPRAGGGAFHCARGLRLLGAPARIVTKLAREDADTILRSLLALGVEVAWHPASSTSVFRLDYHGQARTTTLGRARRAVDPDDVAGWVGRALRGIGWLHVAPLARSDFPTETLAALARGRRLSFDGQGLVRPARTGVLVPDGEYDPAVLEHVAILKLAEEEAAVVLDRVDRASIEALGIPEVLPHARAARLDPLRERAASSGSAAIPSRRTRPVPATRSPPRTSSRGREGGRRTPRR